jgi:hypothetical protein
MVVGHPVAGQEHRVARQHVPQRDVVVNVHSLAESVPEFQQVRTEQMVGQQLGSGLGQKGVLLRLRQRRAATVAVGVVVGGEPPEAWICGIGAF